MKKQTSLAFLWVSIRCFGQSVSPACARRLLSALVRNHPSREVHAAAQQEQQTTPSTSLPCADASTLCHWRSSPLVQGEPRCPRSSQALYRFRLDSVRRRRRDGRAPPPRLRQSKVVLRHCLLGARKPRALHAPHTARHGRERGSQVL